jgi:hypothetical protein
MRRLCGRPFVLASRSAQWQAEREVVHALDQLAVFDEDGLLRQRLSVANWADFLPRRHWLHA